MRTEITKAIKELRGQYIDKGVSSYFEINNGKCEDFAEDLVRSLETKCDAGKMFVVENGNFCLNGDCFGGKWDWKLLDEWGIASPQGLACSEVDNIDFGAHVWAVIDGRHYDAESPEGVESFFDLPIFRRPIIMALRKKGICTEEVCTEDVSPPPLCPVGNPITRD